MAVLLDWIRISLFHRKKIFYILEKVSFTAKFIIFSFQYGVNFYIPKGSKGDTIQGSILCPILYAIYVTSFSVFRTEVKVIYFIFNLFQGFKLGLSGYCKR